MTPAAPASRPHASPWQPICGILRELESAFVARADSVSATDLAANSGVSLLAIHMPQLASVRQQRSQSASIENPRWRPLSELPFEIPSDNGEGELACGGGAARGTPEL